MAQSSLAHIDVCRAGNPPVESGAVTRPRPALRLVARPSSGRRLEPAELRHLLHTLDLRRRRAQIRARRALAIPHP